MENENNKQDTIETKKEYMKNYNKQHKEKKKEYNRQYYLNNTNRMKKLTNEWRENNQQRVIEINTQYRIDNREEINKQKKTKVICNICNSEVTIVNLARHKKTLKCSKFKECVIIEN